MKHHKPDDEVEFLITDGGPFDQSLKLAGLNKPGPKHLGLLLLALAVICWLPLLILSAKNGLLLGNGVQIPFLHDFAVHTRFLLALPLLVGAEMAIAPRLRSVIRHFFTSGLVLEKDLPEFRQAIIDALKWKQSRTAELIILIIIIIQNVSRLEIESSLTLSSWHDIQSAEGLEPTAAGWWNLCVSMPIFQFFLYRWLWRFGIWSNLLRRIAKLDLQLFPIHPDHVGGLGFLTEGQAKFAIIILALSSLVSASIANLVLYSGESLVSFKFLVALFVLLVLIIFLGPLVVFTPKLIHLKREGILDYSALATSYAQAFDNKWLRGGNHEGEPFLGTGDIQSLADLSTSVEIVSAMKPFPVDPGTVKGLVVAAILPFLPLVATVIPLKDLFKQIIGILL